MNSHEKLAASRLLGEMEKQAELGTAALLGGLIGALKKNEKAPAPDRFEGFLRGAGRGLTTLGGTAIGGLVGGGLGSIPRGKARDIATPVGVLIGAILGTGKAHQKSRDWLGEYGYNPGFPKSSSVYREKLAMLLDGQGGDREPREFSEDEEREIAKGKRKLLRGPFASSREPATKRLASPKKQGILGGITAGLVGAAYGGGIGAITNGKSGKGALVGGALAGIPVGLLAYLGSRQQNEDIEDALSRLPEGATIRDLEREPLYRDRLMRGAVMLGRGR